MNLNRSFPAVKLIKRIFTIKWSKKNPLSIIRKGIPFCRMCWNLHHSAHASHATHIRHCWGFVVFNF